MIKRKIYFVHEGHEAYPEIAAYKDFFKDDFICEESHPNDLEKKPDLSKSICWFIMGYYPKKPNAYLTIHDYRSLSVGKMIWLKDKIKRYTNFIPDIRIFQNEVMSKKMSFCDDVPLVYIPMGVPSFITEYISKKQEIKKYDFCYIGVMSKERKIHLMFDSFIKRFGSSKSFYLCGSPEKEIVEHYNKYKNIIFAGKLPQKEVFEAIKQSKVAVNYFPDHYPHLLQTPTKLLEYSAIGARILCNDHPQSRIVSNKYGIECFWDSTKNMFKNVPNDLDWNNNEGFDPITLLWQTILLESNIMITLCKVLKEK